MPAPYLQDRKGVLAHFAPSALRFSAIKYTVLVGATAAAASSSDSDDESSPLCAVPATIGLKVSLECAQLSTQRALEDALLSTTDERTCNKFVKSVSKSALRKVERYSSESLATVALKVVKSAFVAGSLMHVSLFVVTEAHYYVRLLLAKRGEDGGKKHSALVAKAGDFADFTKHNALLTVASMASGAALAAVGTLFEPGTGSFIGQLVGDNLIYIMWGRSF